MKNFLQIKKNLKKDFSNLNTTKLAILGDSATQFLNQAIRGTGFDHDMNIEIWEADYNQIERQVYDKTSELYHFNPDVVLIFRSSHKLLAKYNKQETQQHFELAKNELKVIEELCDTISNTINAKIIYYNYSEINDSVFGNYANKTESSFVFQLRKLNFELMSLAIKKANLFVGDISSVQNEIGKTKMFQPSLYISTDMVLSLDALPKLSAITVDLIKAINGKFKKCIILDLDNTTWGGIIGDDGVENIQIGSLGIGKAFSELQHWVKKLKNRGIIVCICSKNTESVAKEPFEKHPDMVLRLEDISVFKANWENKADNIRQIQKILNIGFDSMVFLDDNPFERNIVRENIPEIVVPELPEDPVEYLEYLYSLNLFETVSFSNEDKERTKLYQIEAQRVKENQKYTDENDFLKNLNMISEINSFNKFNTPRVAQLSQRSNQFNLRTIRYTESDIERISNSKDHATMAFTLEDKFGDNGLICVIILVKEDSETLFIDTWFMSCRVLKRGMENFVLNKIVDYAKSEGFKTIKGEFISTPKNSMVQDHYLNLGFKEEESFFTLDISNYKTKENYINTKK